LQGKPYAFDSRVIRLCSFASLLNHQQCQAAQAPIMQTDTDIANR
jgi:hypothetical protein